LRLLSAILFLQERTIRKKKAKISNPFPSGKNHQEKEGKNLQSFSFRKEPSGKGRQEEGGGVFLCRKY